MGSYLRPTSLSDALIELNAGPRVVLAGGTDFYPARVGRLPDEDVLDISAILELRAIEADETSWRIPALSTWTDLAEAPLPPVFDGLKQAAVAIGGRQIQNRGTLCGNVCNASPAADGLPNLMALDAAVELSSVRGTRRIAVGEFVTGNRLTMRRPDEMVTAVVVPRTLGEARSSFHKLGARAYLVISIVMVAGVVEIVGRRVANARIVVGACSPVARRLPGLEDALTGQDLDPGLADLVASDQLSTLAPIDDVRGSALYRREAALVLVRRVVTELAAR